MPLDTKRHDALFDKTTCTYPVHIIGVGGIGSHVAQFLAKLGVGEYGPIHAWDHDIVEAHNVANQAYFPKDVGRPKVNALQVRYGAWSGAHLHAHAIEVADHIELSGVVFLCVDNNDTKKDICQRSIWRNPEISLLIDPRMDARIETVLTLDPNRERHIGAWEEAWFSHDEAENYGGCGDPNSVITTSAGTAIRAVQQFLHWHQFGIENIWNQLEYDTLNCELHRNRW